MNPVNKPTLKLYTSEAEAATFEGTISGIDGSLYDSLEEAESYFPEGGVFAFVEDDAIRVAWTAESDSMQSPPTALKPKIRRR
jgi:hypothetical protein